MRVIIAAAGTAGHINPGLAIANKIKKEEKDSKIIFIGTTRGLENDLVPRAGYELKTIDAYGLSKKITIENMKKMMKTLKGFKEAKKIIQEFKPDIVIGTGGYICGATIWEANKLKIPTMLHESNAFPGKAVKMLAKKTNTITNNETKTTAHTGLSKEFKEAMDSYEAFIDEYVAFMKKYSDSNGTDMSLISDYTKYMTKLDDANKKFEKWNDSNMNAEESAYYIQVQTRVNKKLLEAAQ